MRTLLCKKQSQHKLLVPYSISSLEWSDAEVEEDKGEEKWTIELNVVLKAYSEVDYPQCMVRFKSCVTWVTRSYWR